MNITEIICSAGRTFNNPYESYSNFKIMETLKAQLDDQDDTDESIAKLQSRTEEADEAHKKAILANLKAEQE